MHPADQVPRLATAKPTRRRHHRATLEPILLSIVIVNYRQWRNTARLTRQLIQSPAIREGLAEIVIVDNGSRKHSSRTALRRMRGVSVRCLPRNVGFAAGVNEGCRLSRGDWYLLLNPDVSVSPDLIEQLLDRIRTAPSNNGVIGLGLRDPNGRRQPSCGEFPTFWMTLAGLLKPRSRRKCRAVTKPGHVPWVTGCGLLVRRQVMQTVGGFDPSFFLYYEDVDFCRRVWEAGWTVSVDPAIRVTHHHPLHHRAVPPRTRLMTRHALLNYAEKYWPAWHTRLTASLIWLESTLRRRWHRLRDHQKAVRSLERLRHLAAEVARGNPLPSLDPTTKDAARVPAIDCHPVL